jgi:hypothetical protein
MSTDPDSEDTPGEPDKEPADHDIDEAVDDSFPASDPPSYGSAEPGGTHPGRTP